MINYTFDIMEATAAWLRGREWQAGNVTVGDNEASDEEDFAYFVGYERYFEEGEGYMDYVETDWILQSDLDKAASGAGRLSLRGYIHHQLERQLNP